MMKPELLSYLSSSPLLYLAWQGLQEAGLLQALFQRAPREPSSLVPALLSLELPEPLLLERLVLAPRVWVPWALTQREAFPGRRSEALPASLLRECCLPSCCS